MAQEDSHRFDERFHSEFADLIKWRRDVRRFRTDPIKPEILSELLELTQLSPSVGLSEPWRFIAVEKTEARARVIASFERCNQDALAKLEGDDARIYAGLKLEGLREAPVHYAVFADHGTDKGKGLGRNTMPQMLDYSVVIAVHTFWLAARTHNIGVGWVSILEPAAIAAAAGAPNDWRLIAYLCVGYPLEQHLDPELERAGWEQRSGATPTLAV